MSVVRLVRGRDNRNWNRKFKRTALSFSIYAVITTHPTIHPPHNQPNSPPPRHHPPTQCHKTSPSVLSPPVVLFVCFVHIEILDLYDWTVVLASLYLDRKFMRCERPFYADLSAAELDWKQNNLVPTSEIVITTLFAIIRHRYVIPVCISANSWLSFVCRSFISNMIRQVVSDFPCGFVLFIVI